MGSCAALPSVGAVSTYLGVQRHAMKRCSLQQPGAGIQAPTSVSQTPWLGSPWHWSCRRPQVTGDTDPYAASIATKTYLPAQELSPTCSHPAAAPRSPWSWESSFPSLWQDASVARLPGTCWLEVGCGAHPSKATMHGNARCGRSCNTALLDGKKVHG